MTIMAVIWGQSIRTPSIKLTRVFVSLLSIRRKSILGASRMRWR